MRLWLPSFVLWLCLALPSFGAGRTTVPALIQASLVQMTLTPTAHGEKVAHLTGIAKMPGMLAIQSNLLEYGHYDFTRRSVTLSSRVLEMPPAHAAPLAGHELHHQYEHESGIIVGQTFGAELRAHEVQAKLTRIAMETGLLQGEIIKVESPSIGTTVPVLMPAHLAEAARRLFAGEEIGFDEERLVRYYRGLSTTLTAHDKKIMHRVIMRFYPHLAQPR